MALTEQDRETIELIATRVAEKFTEAQSEAVQAMIDHHKDTCPHGKRLLESKWFIAGIAAVVILLTAGGSALGNVVLKLLGM